MQQAEPAETHVEWRSVRWLARSLPIFHELDDTVLDAIADRIEWLALPGGTTLFDAGEPADAMYFIVSGCLAVYAGGQLIGEIRAGESVGEMALISGKPRNATVKAVRDSELGRLPRESFEALMLSQPQALLSITRLLVQRLEAARLNGAQARRSVPRTFAIVVHPDVQGATSFAARFATELERIGRTQLIWHQRGAEHTSQWFHQLERDNEFVIYTADAAPTSWTKLCLRQADVVILLTRSDLEPSTWPALEALGPDSGRQRRVLALQHRATAPSRTGEWLERFQLTEHYHVRGSADLARMARMLTGRAVGVVLSGGGARGFAHLGVLRALQEQGVVIDATGGTSIGAIVAAGFAAGWTLDELQARLQRSFVDTNPVNDYTIPFVALVAGRKVTRLLQREFEGLTIEDLPLPFFCVSSNLSSGQIAIHQRGALWRWLRASVAIPGVLPPVFHRGEVFVDGATINNLPVDVMHRFGAGRVIGVDVGADRVFTTNMEEGDTPPLWRMFKWLRSRGSREINILQVLWRASMINSAVHRDERRAQSDLLLQPELEHIDLLNWRAFRSAMQTGYEHASAKLTPAVCASLRPAAPHPADSIAATG